MAYNQYAGNYGQPPNQPPPPGGPYPPQNQPPPHGQQPYPPQPQQYPPQQQQWGQPPPGQYNQPPPQQYNQPGQWGQQPPPNQQQWGAPPPPGQYQQPPPQGQQYGAAPVQHGATGQAHGQPTHPHGGDPRSDAIRIHDAISKFNPSTREHLEFIKTIGSVQNDHQMGFLRQTYQNMYGRDLLELVRGKSTGDYEELCETLLRPQAERDAYFVHKAIDRAGTSEDLLNDVVLGRSKEEIGAMKAAYSKLYNRDLVSAVKGDLSMKTEDLFIMILDERGYGDKEQARWAPQTVQRDAGDLHAVLHASKGGLLSGSKVDVRSAITILAQRAPGQLKALDQEYTRRGWNLEKDINAKFKDHMKDALLIMLRRDVNPALSDAEQLERSMKGIGTHEALLTNATIRAHWKSRVEVQNAYRKLTGKDLKQRISGETSSKYRDLLIELLYPSTQVGYR